MSYKARIIADSVSYANFEGWRQYRSFFKNENLTQMPETQVI
mgnify:CR=1 FL=1